MKFKSVGINIFKVLEQAKTNKPCPNITVGTYFSLKGLEYDTVYIESDLNTQVQRIIENGGPSKESEHTSLKGYYVACSRAQHTLKNAEHLQGQI